MDYIKASELYQSNPTEEVLHEVTEELVKEMTLKEKIRMMQGHAMGVTVKNFLKSGRFYNAEPYAAGGYKRLNIPEVLFADGPRGIVLGKSTCFPVSMLRGATFDDELEYKVGEVFAKEASAGGAKSFCGNLHKSSAKRRQGRQNIILRWNMRNIPYSPDSFMDGIYDKLRAEPYKNAKSKDEAIEISQKIREEANRIFNTDTLRSLSGEFNPAPVGKTLEHPAYTLQKYRFELCKGLESAVYILTPKNTKNPLPQLLNSAVTDTE